MQNIIADLWNGEVAPIETCGVSNSEIRELIRLMDKNEENLNRTFSESQKEIFEKYNGCMDEYLALMAEEAFCEGFCLGSRLLAQTFAEK